MPALFGNVGAGCNSSMRENHRRESAGGVARKHLLTVPSPARASDFRFFHFDLRRFWLTLVCVILGPFAPWIAYLGKLRRRGLAAPGWWLVLAAAFCAVYAVLWLAPLPWTWIWFLYAALGLCSGIGFFQAGADRYFKPLEPARAESGVVRSASWRESLGVAALVVYPALFGAALFRDVNRLRAFAIHLPASVYTDALRFTLEFGTPSALLLAWLVRRAGFRPGVRLVLNLYGGLLVILAWVTVWQRAHLFGLRLFGAPAGEPLLHDVYREAAFRRDVQDAFYAGGVFLGASYLASAARSFVLIRRAVFVGLPVLLGYANLLLLLGEGAPFMAGVREHLYREGNYPAFRAMAEIESARFPAALNVPFLQQDLADLAYLRGDSAAAARWRHRILQVTADKPYDADLRERIAWEQHALAVHPGCTAPESLQVLPVPRVRPAATLDGNWYALLSVVAYFRPDWSDFEMKKKLLEVSPQVQLAAPSLNTVPAVAEALDVFGLPFSPCFLDSAGIHRALRAGKIPLINQADRWMPVVGWDPCRRGYLCYRYPDSLEKNPWLNPADKEVLFGVRTGLRHRSEVMPDNLITFLSEHEVLNHLHDIGGVALVLGDSNFAPAAERRAAYLTEFGDVLYQDHDDLVGAAQAYARAQALYPTDYIVARQAYLERRARWEEGSPYGLEAVFRSDVRTRPLPTGLDPAERTRIVRRILHGDLGQYLLVNWLQAWPRFFAVGDSAARDTSRRIFRTWLTLHPHNPAALDSIGAGFAAQRQWDSAEVYYRRTMAYYPLGNEYLAYRLAWTLFQRGRFDTMQVWLARCPSFQLEAGYLLMRGAGDWNSGHHAAALAALKKSLKLDKTLPETHAWMARVSGAEGDTALRNLSRRWLQRTEP